MHTRKSVVVADKKKRVLVLTKQRSGRRHDKRLADKDLIFEQLPTDIDAYADTAFAGEKRVNARMYIPQKKPKGRQLMQEQKEINALISSVRIVVEHAISGIKRYRSVSKRMRNRKAFIDDRLLLPATGLWNYHVR